MCGLSGNHLQSRLFYLEHFYKFGDDGGFRGTLKMGGWRQLVWGGTQGRTLLHGCHHTSHNSKTIMKLRRPGRVGGSQEPWVNASRAGGSEECILPHSAQVPGPGPGPGGAGISWQGVAASCTHVASSFRSLGWGSWGRGRRAYRSSWGPSGCSWPAKKWTPGTLHFLSQPANSQPIGDWGSWLGSRGGLPRVAMACHTPGVAFHIIIYETRTYNYI